MQINAAVADDAIIGSDTGVGADGDVPAGGDATPDPAEAAARAKGWRPKEEYEGDGWVDAKEFLAREPLFERIKGQSKELKEMRKTIDAMAKHFQSATQAAVQSKLNELKAAKREAIELGDVDRVDAIEREMHQQAQTRVDIPTKTDLAPEIADWIESNKWFTEDEERREFAIAYNESYLKKHPGDLEESLKKTLDATKRAFPEKFSNPARDRAPAVEGTAAPQATSKRWTVDRLTSEQKLAYKQYVQVHKVLSHDEYFKDLEAIGELK